MREDSAEAARWRAQTKLEDAAYKKASDKIRAKVGGNVVHTPVNSFSTARGVRGRLV